MARRAAFESIDAGDLEVFHPKCRKKILMTRVEVQRDARGIWLFVEGICATCDCYVRLRLVSSGLDNE